MPLQYNAKKYIYSALHIGHRGSGQSNNHGDPSAYKSLFKENTIYSFVQAAKKGVNFVEFDVLLTKDRIPIVYHDFQTRVSLERMGSRLTDFHDLEINQLSLKELQSLKLDFATGRKRLHLRPVGSSLRRHLIPMVASSFPHQQNVLKAVAGEAARYFGPEGRCPDPGCVCLKGQEPDLEPGQIPEGENSHPRGSVQEYPSLFQDALFLSSPSPL